jgi:hypothetical protein
VNDCAPALFIRGLLPLTNRADLREQALAFIGSPCLD